jgi:hypothetical protein
MAWPQVAGSIRAQGLSAADRWQGIHPDGALFDIRSGAMPPKQRLLVFDKNDGHLAGLIRLIPATKQQTNKHNLRSATSTSGQ